MLSRRERGVCLAKSSKGAQLASSISVLPLVRFFEILFKFLSNTCFFRSLSLFGAALCIAIMFISHWGFALLAFVIGVVVYKYIEYRG